MSEMVDRVAKELEAAHKRRSERLLAGDELSVPDLWIDLSRVAIAAMREPTASMIQAAGYRYTDKDVKDWMETHDWPTMIDEALRE